MQRLGPLRHDRRDILERGREFLKPAGQNRAGPVLQPCSLRMAVKIPPEVKQQMLDIATRQGFDVSKLLWVNQQY